MRSSKNTNEGSNVPANCIPYNTSRHNRYKKKSFEYSIISKRAALSAFSVVSQRSALSLKESSDPKIERLLGAD